MRELQLDDGGDEAQNTDSVVMATRRPIIIARQKPVILEMEAGLSDQLVAGTSDHPRLKQMLARLDDEVQRRLIEDRIALIAQDDRYGEYTLHDALIEECCLAREHGRIQVAELQLHLMGIYRQVRAVFQERQDQQPRLEDLRNLRVSDLTRLLRPVSAEFGHPGLSRELVVTPTAGDRALAVVRRLRLAAGDSGWADAAGDPQLAREDEAPLLSLPEDERAAARSRLVQSRVRSLFYQKVFIEFFAIDEFDPDANRHATVLGWIEAIEACPHLYPFMQGQTVEQKSWRLVRLAEKVLQLHEVYARIASAAVHPTYRDDFASLSTRERLNRLAKDHYPPLPATRQLTVAVMLCPFSALVSFIQAKVKAQDLVLPPDPRR